MSRSATNYGNRKEELFIAAIEFLSKKYKIENYTVITKSGYHVEAETEDQLEMKKELIKLFQK